MRASENFCLLAEQIPACAGLHVTHLHGPRVLAPFQSDALPDAGRSAQQDAVAFGIDLS